MTPDEPGSAGGRTDIDRASGRRAISRGFLAPESAINYGSEFRAEGAISSRVNPRLYIYIYTERRMRAIRFLESVMCRLLGERISSEIFGTSDATRDIPDHRRDAVLASLSRDATIAREMTDGTRVLFQEFPR